MQIRQQIISLLAGSLIATVAVTMCDAGERWRSSHPTTVQNSQNDNSCDAVCEWVRDLKQPDNPNTSCCAEADRYEADDFERDDHGGTVAIITDGKGDIPNGTKIPVPDKKYKWDKGNPTGRGQIFMRFDAEGLDDGTWIVFCFVPGAGA